jgi:hypothetical protein
MDMNDGVLRKLGIRGGRAALADVLRAFDKHMAVKQIDEMRAWPSSKKRKL